MIQTLKDFIDNPMGKGSNAIMQKHLIVQDLKLRMEKLATTKHIERIVYIENDDYYIHFILPSESERNNTYDVVIKFSPSEPNQKADSTIDRYSVKFFSNCPSFTFTFAHAFNQHDMVITELKDKYEDIVFEKEPSTRNASMIMSYEKSITISALYVLHDPLLTNKAHLSKIAKKGINSLIKNVRNTDRIKLEIGKANQELKKLRDEKLQIKVGTKSVKLPITKKEKPKNNTNRSSSVNKITPKGKKTPKKKITARKGL